MRLKGLKIHRVTSWLITLFALITIFLGYAATRRWFSFYDLFLFLHLTTGWIFPGLLLFHFIFSIRYVNLKWSRIRASFKKDKISSTIILRLFQKITKWIIIFFAILISLSGLSFYPLFNPILGSFLAFSIHIDFDVILSIFMILHVTIGARFYFTRKRIKSGRANLSLVFLMVSLIFLVIIVDLPPGLGNPEIKIEGTIYRFDPNEIVSIRSDLFQVCSFSVFDILLYLNSTGKISLTSHFNNSMDTYIIDSINGDTGYWWYQIHYSGGGIEKNVERIDHYPWKPGAVIVLYHETQFYIDEVYLLFKEEVARLTLNNNSIIIPTVSIIGHSFSVEFYNLTVIPHNLRYDLFKNDVITAIDVIMTLGDLGNITYELTWFESFRGASYVHSYFVSKINTDQTSGRCGFLYELNDSYIFLSADERIISSPESVRFFWGCL
ncbi:MAG: cytochrome b/b6 domain-containing protein [Candidatus Hermodarchaeota archaeon]